MVVSWEKGGGDSLISGNISALHSVLQIIMII